mgnify:CR=1 FL=1
MNISNLLTILRILVIPLIVLLIYLKDPFSGWLAFILFCLAGITDFFDGYIARIRKEISDLGTFLDPIADKLLVSAVILILTSKGVIDGLDIIPALIILLREIAVSGLREFLAGIKISVPVSKIAKFKTALQMFSLSILILCAGTVEDSIFLLMGKLTLWTAALLTLYTGYDYLKSGFAYFK